MSNIRGSYEADTPIVPHGGPPPRDNVVWTGRRRGHGGALVAAAALSASLGVLLVLFLVAPVVGVAAAGGAEGARRLVTDAELGAALLLTAATATAATLAAALTGTPLAWALARRRVPGRALVEALLDLPLVLPHPVAGVALLLVLGRASPVGAWLVERGLSVVGTPGGIVCAMLFVSAPLYVSAARESFSSVDPSLELVARTLGAGPWRAFRRVTLPLAGRGLVAGLAVTWARSVSEFGAVVVVAYNPKVVSVLSYERLTAFGLREALPVAAALLLASVGPLAALRAVRERGRAPR